VIPDLPAALPAGLTARPARWLDPENPDPADLAAVHALVRRCETASVGAPESTTDETTEMLVSPTTDREATLLVHDGDALVAFVWVEYDPTGAESWIDPWVDPDRHDLYPAILRWAREVAHDHRSRAGADPAAPWTLRGGCYVDDAALVRAFEDAGFARVRRFWRMRADLATVAIPQSAGDDSALPPGVAVVDAYAEPLRRTAYEVQTAAFADHWNHTARAYEEWDAYFRGAWEDPAGWWLLTVDGVPAAVCILDDSRAENGDGYVRSLGVLREFRGRGLAQLLLQRAFARYRDEGRGAVLLGVDSSSPTGAQRLYERVGMRPHRVIDAWSLDIA
jgi:ribosomal protein S18 acetylase RimI-like enzyme